MIAAGIILLGIAAAVLFFWKVIFLRNPNRTTPEGNYVIAPADGKVIEVFEFTGEDVHLFKGGKELLGNIYTLTKDVAKSGYIISVFMSPLDVHHNRAPIGGKVVSVKHSDGRFKAVNSFEAGLVNEKTETISKGPIKVKMI